MKLEQVRLEQENANEKMLLELMQAANNLDEARHGNGTFRTFVGTGERRI